MSAQQPPSAVERRSHWPGWIWAVPIAALGIVIWLGLRSWLSGGPEVTVIFPEMANLSPGNTQVKFQDIVVGQVDSVHVEKDLRHMRVRLNLHADMEGHLGKGTEFWIEGNKLSLTNLSTIKAIISGAYIAMEPSPGPKQSKYIGLGAPPVLSFGQEGTAFILHTNKLDGIERGTPIYYLSKQVGEVRSCKMIDARGFDVIAVVKAPYDALVHTGTRFWSESAIRLSNGSNGLALQFQSVPALVEGAIAFETPFGPTEGPPARKSGRFKLYEGRAAAENAPDSEGVSYRVVFTGTAKSLAKYAPVKLMGSRVGSVSESALVYSPATGKMSIRAIIVIEPYHITLANGRRWNDGRGQMDSMMERLVAQGLRAEIASSPPVIGGQMVVLRMVPGEHGRLIPGDIPEIPTSSGSGVAGILASANDIATKVDRMPLSQIANNIHDTTRHIARLVRSPAMRGTLHHIDRSAANIDTLTTDARRQMPAALRSLQQSLAETQTTLASVQGLLSANGPASNQPESTDVPQALYEVTRTARSVRELSDFLNRHPDALIWGRGSRE